MSESFSQELLSSLVCAHVPVDGELLRFEHVPTGHFNTTLFVETPGNDLVLRIAPPDDAGFVFYEAGMMAQEPGIHAVIRERTDAPVAAIVAYDDSRSLVDRDYLIMERLPGVPLTHFQCTRQQRDRVLEQIGHYLRQIHGIKADTYGYLGEHNCMGPQEDWPSAFRIMWHKMTDDIVGSGYYDRDEEAYVKAILEKHWQHFERPVTSRLLHMDIWDQNILVGADGNVTGIVDFDRAVWGDKEIEFAILDYCGISEPAFWRGYGMERDTSDGARIRQLFYLLYEVQKYIVIYHYRNREGRSCDQYKQQVMNLFSQL